jgi:hypothetical protein
MDGRICVIDEAELRRIVREEFTQAVDARTRWLTEKERNKETFIGVNELKELTGYNQSTIALKIKTGVLKPIKKAGSNRNMFCKQDVLDLISKGELRKKPS